jgi:DNA polymerase I-like protein with 3'-5' exonuclease and polymerase domains
MKTSSASEPGSVEAQRGAATPRRSTLTSGGSGTDTTPARGLEEAGPERVESIDDIDANEEIRSRLVGRIVIPTLHPAFLLRGADAWRPVVAVDIKRACRWVASGGLKLWDDGPYVEVKTARALRAALAQFGRTVNVDVETDSPEPMTCDLKVVGIADVFHSGETMPIVVANPWRPAMAAVLQRFLSTRVVVTHNGPAFDEIVLKRFGVTYRRKEDTLIAHHSFASHLPKSLAHVVSVYVDSGAWKMIYRGREMGEKGSFGIADEDLSPYNAADVRLGSMAWRRMQPDLAKERRVYEQNMAMADLMRRMQETGILVDKARKDALSKHMRYREGALLGLMRVRVGSPDFHPNKLRLVREAIYKDRRVDKITPTGLPSTNREVLEAIRHCPDDAGRLADQILRWRHAHDVRVEYLDDLPVLADGRVHPHYRSYGTRSGRPASHKPNILNTPRMASCKSKGCGVTLVDGVQHKLACTKPSPCEPEAQIRDVYIADPGHVFVYYDLSQSEMRFAAHISGDEAFMEACAKDVHAGNAAVLFPDAREVLMTDPKGAGKKFRDIAKNAGFGILYKAEVPKIFTFLRGKGFLVSLDDVEAMFAKVHQTYWRYYQFCEENVDFCRRHGYLRSPFLGRIHWLGWYPKPTDIANYPVQSSVADVMNERLLISDKRLPKEAKLLVYAYDSGTYLVPEKLVPEVERTIRDIWAEPIRVPANGIEFVQPIDFKTGARWSDFG